MLTLLGKLKTQKNLSEHERQLADYILMNKERVILMSVNELTQNAKTSLSNVYRLCKKCKINGFSEFKTTLASEINQDINEYRKIDYDKPFSKYDSSFNIAQKMGNLYWQSIAYTLSVLDFDEIEKIAEMILSKRNISLLTSHFNIAVAETFARRMRELGIHIRVYTEINDQRLSCSLSSAGDLSIILTYSGKSFFIKDCIQELYRNKVDIVLICGTRNESLLHYAKHQLFLCSEEDDYMKIANFSSFISAQYLFDLIYSIIYQKEYDTYFTTRKKRYLLK